MHGICHYVSSPYTVVHAAVENTHVTVAERSGVKAEVCLLIYEERAIDLEMRARPVPGSATGEPDTLYAHQYPRLHNRLGPYPTLVSVLQFFSCNLRLMIAIKHKFLQRPNPLSEVKRGT